MNNKFSPADIHIAYNDIIGIVYHVNKGKIKSTTPAHAALIETAFNQYIDGGLTQEDKEMLEAYIEESFESFPSRTPVFEDTSLDTSDTLKHLQIMVALDCNLNCKYCYANGGNYGYGNKIMGPSEAVGFLKELLVGRYEAVGTVMFFGGEPTLQPKTIVAVCDFFEESVNDNIFKEMPIFTMVTNGTLIDESMAAIIAKYKISTTISIDGPKDINDSVRVTNDGKGTHDSILKGIENLKEAGSAPAAFEATYTSLHEDMGYSKSDIVSYLKNNLADVSVFVGDCGPTGNPEYSNLEVKYTGHFVDDSNFIKNAVHEKLESSLFQDISCGAGLVAMTITPNGQLYPCHFFVNNDEYYMGQVSNFPNSDGFRNTTKAMHNARRTKFERCKDCWASELCTTCPAKLLLPRGEELINDTCAYIRKEISNALLELANEAFVLQ